MTDILAGIGQAVGAVGSVIGGNEIPQRQIGISIKLAQNTQLAQPNTFAGLGSSGGGLGSITSGALSSLTGGALGGNQINILGLRCIAQVRNAGSPLCEANVKIFGLPPSVLNQLNSLGMRLNTLPGNILTVSAGDNRVGLAPIYQGNILQAFADYNNQPDVPLIIIANPGGMVTNTSVTSFPSGFSVAEAMNTLAGKMGLTFVNAGNVNLTLPPMYLSGSPIMQIRKLVQAAGVTFGLNPKGILELHQKGTPRTDGQTITISKQTGMIASPTFTVNGIMVKTLFNPQINFLGKIMIQSSVLNAVAAAQQASAQGGTAVSTTWTANQIDHDLESLVPRGQWMTTINAYPSGTNPKLPASS